MTAPSDVIVVRGNAFDWGFDARLVERAVARKEWSGLEPRSLGGAFATADASRVLVLRTARGAIPIAVPAELSMRLIPAEKALALPSELRLTAIRWVVETEGRPIFLLDVDFIANHTGADVRE